MRGGSCARSGRGPLALYYANLDSPPIPVRLLRRVVSGSERARAESMREERSRDRRIAARGLLRHLLGGLRGQDPAGIELRVTPRGKPFLPDGATFNVSHSGPHFLVAVAPDGNVGVDVEEVRAAPLLGEMARRMFAPEEVAALRRYRGFERDRAIVRTWVRKEALLKASGRGLSAALRTFAVSVAPGPGDRLRRVEDPELAGGDWRVTSVALGGPLEGAVAWDRPELAPTSLEWPFP